MYRLMANAINSDPSFPIVESFSVNEVKPETSANMTIDSNVYLVGN